MYTQFNYYNQNNPFIKADPLIQTSFNRIGINNYQKSYINMNENYNISCQKNNIHSRLKNINEAAVFNSLIILKETLLKILDQLNSNYICKIYKLNNHSSTGFFCKIPYFNSTLPVLITTSQIFNKEDLKVNRIIKIILIERDKEREREKEIKIVINEPRITFTDEKLNVTIIEIIPEVDKIDNFLEVDNKIDKNNMKNKIKNAYILFNSQGELNYTTCEINKFNDQNIFYLCSTYMGSSGAPILSLINYKIVGVHQGNVDDLKIGILMKYIIDAFNKTYDINKWKLNLQKEEKEKGTEINTLNNNEFYVGDLENGKIAIYYSDEKIKYEGDRVNGKFEGKGIYYYRQGNRYEGEWKKGLKHGKGILYYDLEAQNKRYEGNYIKGEFEGYGIYYWEDGSFYKGDFKKGKKHGYGEYYKKVGIIKYRGEFINEKYEGKGVYYCKNGDYYIGEFKKGLKHGKGILYNKKGEVIKKGKFVYNEYQDKK